MVTVVLGKRGSGKSEYVKRNILPDLKKTDFIIFDTLREYGKFGTIVENFDDLKDYITFCRKNKQRFHAVCQFEIEEDWEFTFWLYKTKKLTMVIEEVDWFCSPTYISEGLEKNLKYGRHYDCDIVAISRRPAEINRMITAQAQKIVVFEVTEPRDVAYLKQTGFDEKELSNRKQYEPLIKEF